MLSVEVNILFRFLYLQVKIRKKENRPPPPPPPATLSSQERAVRTHPTNLFYFIVDIFARGANSINRRVTRKKFELVMPRI